MADEYTDTESVAWAGAQPPKPVHNIDGLNEQVGQDIEHVPESHVRQHHIAEQEALAASHGRGTGERVKVDQPPDVSLLTQPKEKMK